MKAFLILSLALFTLAVVQGEKVVCKIEDSACLTKTAAAKHRDFAAGIPGEVESSDPLYQEKIELDQEKLKYVVNKAKLFGIKDCVLQEVKFFEEVKQYELLYYCPLLTLVGDYEISGEIGGNPIEGKGDIKIEYHDHSFRFYGGYVSYEDAEGKIHINLKTYSIEVHIDGRVIYELHNLYNGDKEKSEKIHEYLNEYKNSQDIEQKHGLQVWVSFSKPYFINLNDLLKVKAFADLFSYLL